MIYLKLFLVFLEIGAVSFGGGYGMIPLIREKVLENDWLTEEGFLSFVAVSESTPGPLAVNMATFVGASQGGFFGALCATFGVVLPAFLVILLIAAVLGNLLRFAGVQATLSGMRPVIVGLNPGHGVHHDSQRHFRHSVRRRNGRDGLARGSDFHHSRPSQSPVSAP